MKNKFALSFMNQSNEKGFALPIAMGMGLFLLLIGMTMMYRSQSDRVSATTQKSTTQGLSAAETGVTRYQSLINNYRAIATYPSSGATSWTNASNIPGFTACTANPTDVASQSGTQWQDIDASDPSKGQYRLVSYSFTPDTGTAPNAPGTSTLIVEGRVNQNGSGTTATQDVGTSASRLKVEIPIQVGDINNVSIPGLWLQSGATGGNTIDGSVLLNDCSVNLTSVNMTANNSVTGQLNTISYTSLAFPSLPHKPSFATSQVLGVINSITLTTLGAVSIGGSQQRLTLPRTGDIANSSGVYEYSVTSMDIPNGSELVITPGQKVKIYLDGTITKGGNIIHSCGSVANCKPTNFQILGYGASGNQICMNGNNYIESFIFAPQYQVGVAGSGGGAGGVKGSVWAKDWSNDSSCGSNTSNIVIVQTASWGDIGLTPSNLPPRLGDLSKWERQQVQ